MKFTKPIYAFLASALFLLIMFAAPSDAFAAEHEDCSYYITKYDVNIDVAEDNVLNIEENISVFFNSAQHGIYRQIPLKNYIEREDGSTDTIRAKVKNLSLNEEYVTYKENGKYVIQIGSEDKTVTGSRDYTISYSYVLGQDPSTDFDELYFNIIGTEWDTYIDNVTFTVNMPKEFDETLLGFSSGSYGTSGTENVEYSVEGNEISGKLTKELSPNEALTIRLQLPEGYFYFNKTLFNFKLSLLVLVPFCLLIIFFILWYKFGKDDKLPVVVEFYPPEGLSSLDVAFYFKGKVENTDVVPLLIELANEGCVKINEIKPDGKFKKKSDFTIEKVSEYNGDDQNKKLFFEGLFEKGKKQTVTKQDLYNKFYKTVNAIMLRVNSKKNSLYSHTSKILQAVVIISAIASAVFVLDFQSKIIAENYKYILVLIGIILSLGVLLFACLMQKRTKDATEKLYKIKGFSKFLNTAEKERLEKLAEDNPEYFYDILPYAYVLGVSKEWTKKFESIAVTKPQWYGGDMFDYVFFSAFILRTMRIASNVMISAPAPQNHHSGGGGFSGGFSGGGFSGGGVGGGGGGAW